MMVPEYCLSCFHICGDWSSNDVPGLVERWRCRLAFHWSSPVLKGTGGLFSSWKMVRVLSGCCARSLRRCASRGRDLPQQSGVTLSRSEPLRRTEPLYTKALQLLEKYLGHGHPKTMNVRSNLADLLRQMSRTPYQARLS